MTTRLPRDWIQISVTALPGLAAVIALIFTSLSIRATGAQLQVAEQGQITDRYNAAITNLGSPSVDVRLGGIYALQRIMQDSPRDQPTVVAVLCAFVRDHASAATARSVRPSASPHTSSAPSQPPTDTQAALTVVDTRNTALDGSTTVVDLTGADLTHATLTHANLTYATLTRANLGGANLGGANLYGADLTRANLTGADLTAATLGIATLTGADLTGADLTDATLYGATLGDAALGDATLYGANLTRANLTRADLTRADLTDANLGGAALDGANLTDANLTDANLTDATLYGADLTGADLTRADLTHAYRTGAKGLPTGTPPTTRRNGTGP